MKPLQKRTEALFARHLGTHLSRALNWFRLIGLRRHKQNIRSARSVLKKLEKFSRGPDREARILAYLRKIPSDVFEDLILEVAERAGFFVLRNKRYTGDGGIDGRIHIPGHGWVLVQAKRYREYINPKHVADFSALMMMQNRPGLFVHTGVTGPGSREKARSSNIGVLSGFQLSRIAAGEICFRQWCTKVFARS